MSMISTYIIRLRQISTGHEADSMLFRGTEAEARAHAEAALVGHPDVEIASIRNRDAKVRKGHRYMTVIKPNGEAMTPEEIAALPQTQPETGVLSGMEGCDGQVCL
jgi:hypothetical protein